MGNIISWTTLPALHARQEIFFKAVGIDVRLERHKRYFPRPWHNCNRKMENIVLFQSGQAEQRQRKMDAGRDSGRRIKERNVSGDVLKRNRTDRCAEKAAILLNLDENIDPRLRVKMC